MDMKRRTVVVGSLLTLLICICVLHSTTDKAFLYTADWNKPHNHLLAKSVKATTFLAFKSPSESTRKAPSVKSNALTKLDRRKFRWEPGLSFNHICKINADDRASCCSSVQHTKKMHIEIEGKTLSMDQTVKTFRRKIYNRRVLLFGDSLADQLFLSIWDLLETGLFIPEQVARVPFFKIFREVKQPAQNVHFQFVSFFVLKTSSNCTSTVMLEPRDLQSLIQDFDIIIYNFGLHYEFCSQWEFVTDMTQVADILKAETAKHPKKQVVVRSTLPQHFPGNNGYFVAPRTQFDIYDSCANKTTEKEHRSNKALQNIAEQYGFKYMDSFPIYMERWDLHWRSGDCTHNCYTAEITVPELALLNTLLN